jgi:hypothetical protein
LSVAVSADVAAEEETRPLLLPRHARRGRDRARRRVLGLKPSTPPLAGAKTRARDGAEKRAVCFSHISGLASGFSAPNWLHQGSGLLQVQCDQLTPSPPLGYGRNQCSAGPQQGKRQGSNHSVLPMGGLWLSDPENAPAWKHQTADRRRSVEQRLAQQKRHGVTLSMIRRLCPRAAAEKPRHCLAFQCASELHKPSSVLKHVKVTFRRGLGDREQFVSWWRTWGRSRVFRTSVDKSIAVEIQRVKFSKTRSTIANRRAAGDCAPPRSVLGFHWTPMEGCGITRASDETHRNA